MDFILNKIYFIATIITNWFIMLCNQIHINYELNYSLLFVKTVVDCFCFVGSYLNVFTMGPLPAVLNCTTSARSLSDNCFVIFMFVQAKTNINADI